MQIDQLKTYHKNPRNITSKQFDDLSGWLVRLGDLSGIVVNQRTGEIIGGNQRTKFFKEKKADITITENFNAPDEQGTVALGYVVLDGKKYSYRVVDWDEKTSDEANIIANKAGGTWNFEILHTEFDEELLLDSGFESWELANDGEPEPEKPDTLVIDEKYTHNVEALIYTPKGEKPTVAELYDNTKVKNLEEEIELTPDLPSEVQEFLKYAAQRHRVFDYSKIAEFYAQSTPEIQNLMERSALVIVDFNKAIENGFVKLSEKLEEQFKDEYAESE